ncbi:hypothetical protein JCM11641_003956 [Rhodosporidiobolus odoratus]
MASAPRRSMRTPQASVSTTTTTTGGRGVHSFQAWPPQPIQGGVAPQNGQGMVNGYGQPSYAVGQRGGPPVSSSRTVLSNGAGAMDLDNSPPPPSSAQSLNGRPPSTAYDPAPALSAVAYQPYPYPPPPPQLPQQRQQMPYAVQGHSQHAPYAYGGNYMHGPSSQVNTPSMSALPRPPVAFSGRGQGTPVQPHPYAQVSNGQLAPLGQPGLAGSPSGLPANLPSLPPGPASNGSRPFFTSKHLYDTTLPLAQLAPKIDYNGAIPAGLPTPPSQFNGAGVGGNSHKRPRSPSPNLQQPMQPKILQLPKLPVGPIPTPPLGLSAEEEDETFLAGGGHGTRSSTGARRSVVGDFRSLASPVLPSPVMPVPARNGASAGGKGKQRAQNHDPHADALLSLSHSGANTPVPHAGGDDDDNIPPPMPANGQGRASSPIAVFSYAGPGEDEDADGEPSVKNEDEDEDDGFAGVELGAAAELLMGLGGVGVEMQEPAKKKQKVGKKGRSRARARPKNKNKGKGKAKKEERDSEAPKLKKAVPPPSHDGFILQPLTCANKSASNPLAPILNFYDKCHECTTRRTGYSCLFRGVRSFPVDQDGVPTADPVFLTSLEDDDIPHFPTKYDRPFTLADAEILKTAAAENLIPWLKRELEHAKRPDCAKMKRELAVTATCDGCASTMLCGSFICQRCGRELCLDCAKMLDAVEIVNVPPPSLLSSMEEPPPLQLIYDHPLPNDPILSAAAALPPNSVSKLRLCIRMKHADHSPSHFVPLTRVDLPELERLISEMEKWQAAHPKLEMKGDWLGTDEGKAWLQSHTVEVPEPENSHPILRIPGALIPADMDVDTVKTHFGAEEESQQPEKEEEEDDWSPAELAGPSAADAAERVKAASYTPAPEPSAGSVPAPFPTSLASHLVLTPPSALPASSTPQTDLFRSLWSLGQPFVVDLSPIPPSGYPHLPWSPDYITALAGDEPVTVQSNRPPPPKNQPIMVQEDGEWVELKPERSKEGKERQKEREAREKEREEGTRRCTVAEFFGTLGKAEERLDGISEKIKDWPPAHDFKNKYPELWHDFMSALPAGTVTRRDGVLNISSHSPLNSNPPDLGPKGYFSHISDDGEGGWGSTKLHMDVADALNLMLWSSPGPDGSPGVAVWDLYRAEDSEKIREFLYEKLARNEGIEVEEAMVKHDDPIHTQQIFLDVVLRRELFEEKGVKSYRIHQRPGEVVFIPAGCAHQVCNFADCIKVASDFVSLENVTRCRKLTDEFREQTRHKDLWRADVLQLKSALFWAWYSAERFDRIHHPDLHLQLPVEEDQSQDQDAEGEPDEGVFEDGATPDVAVEGAEAADGEQPAMAVEVAA